MHERVEPYRESEHYAELCAWWIGHGEEPTPPEGLPGDARPGFGYVVRGAAAAFVYRTGTLLWIGPHYLIVNPELHHIAGGKALGAAALDAVMEALREAVAAAGGGHLAAFTERPEVVARARRHGYRLLGRRAWLLGLIVPDSSAGSA